MSAIIRRAPSALLLSTALAACGGAGGGDAPAAAAAPARAGTVWEVDSVDDRAAAPAALQAFVYGMHTVVLDDDDAYAGTTRLRGTRANDGSRTFHLAGGVEARLAPAGDGLALRVADGPAIPMRRQPARPSR